MSHDTASPPETRSASAGTEQHPFRYSGSLAARIEREWQDRWDADGTFFTPNPAGPLAEPDQIAGRPKLFVLDMFPYPSGAGLHVGHPLGFIGTDVYSRFQRMAGYNVLYTMGFDAFGLPAEQFAVQTGQHPAITTAENVAAMRRQLRRIGLSHDTRRSVGHDRPVLLPLDAVDLQPDLRRAGTTRARSGRDRSRSWRPSWPPARDRRRTGARGRTWPRPSAPT